MNVRDLITELEKFPDLATVFVQRADGADTVHRLDSTHEIWVKPVEGGSVLSGPYVEVEQGDGGRLAEPADDYGVLLYG